MRKYLFLTILLSGLCLGARGQTYPTIDLSGMPETTTAQSLRYWFDDNSSTDAQTSTVLDGSAVSISTASLVEGIHVLHYQIVDSKNIAGVPAAILFVKVGVKPTATKLRYWFDNEKTQVVEKAYSTDGQTVDASALLEGIHVLHYQTVDNNGTVGVPVSKLFMKLGPSTRAKATAILYWFDEDAANVKEIGAENLTTTIDASRLWKGDHVLNYQLKMADGSLSPVATAAFNNTNMVREEESVTISSAGQVPFCSDYNLDFTDKPELKAYVATGYDKATGTIWLTRVKEVPANAGFLLIGDKGDYAIPTINGESDVYYENMFKGTVKGTTIQTTDGEYTNYYLSNGASGVGFYKVTNPDGQKIGANRCYLPILTEIPAKGSDDDTEVIKVSAAKQVPYYTSKNVDFTSLEAQGVKAYTATGYNYDRGVIWLTRVKKVPAQTGILVMANEAGEYNVPTTSVASVYENMFTGSEYPQTIYTTETIDDIEYINYYLSNGTSGVSFYKVTNENGVSMGANRSYLQIPKRDSAAGARGNATSCFSKMVIADDDDDVIGIKVFGDMNDGDEGTTGIDIQSPVFNVPSNDVWYNLQGQRVNNPGKGLYIRNGKKVIVK